MHLKSLQLSSDWRHSRSPSGVPCGQISGLAAATRPWMVRRAFVPSPAVAGIHDSAIKHYTALRIALATDKVGMVVTANPSTLLEFGRRAIEQSESLIRDIRDGTLSCEIPDHVRAAIAKPISSPNRKRAAELERLVECRGVLHPRDAWPHLKVLAVWTGGAVGV
jgi:hypothetical protein